MATESPLGVAMAGAASEGCPGAGERGAWEATLKGPVGQWNLASERGPSVGRGQACEKCQTMEGSQGGPGGQAGRGAGRTQMTGEGKQSQLASLAPPRPAPCSSGQTLGAPAPCGLRRPQKQSWPACQKLLPSWTVSAQFSLPPRPELWSPQDAVAATALVCLGAARELGRAFQTPVLPSEA